MTSTAHWVEVVSSLPRSRRQQPLTPPRRQACPSHPIWRNDGRRVPKDRAGSPYTMKDEARATTHRGEPTRGLARSKDQWIGSFLDWKVKGSGGCPAWFSACNDCGGLARPAPLADRKRLQVTAGPRFHRLARRPARHLRGRRGVRVLCPRKVTRCVGRRPPLLVRVSIPCELPIPTVESQSHPLAACCGRFHRLQCRRAALGTARGRRQACMQAVRKQCIRCMRCMRSASVE
jgi:hypothetical protein